MNWLTRTRYDLEVMSAFRFPMPAPVSEDDEVSEEERGDVWEARQAFVDERQQAIEDRVGDLAFLASDEDEWEGPPDPVVMELRWVGDQLEWLEAYRDRLIVFARSFASDTVPVRTIGRCTRLSHSTVVRMITEDAVAEIGPFVSPVAHKYLEGDFDPRDDPEFYRRLRAGLRSDPRADQ